MFKMPLETKILLKPSKNHPSPNTHNTKHSHGAALDCVWCATLGKTDFSLASGISCK